MFDSFESFIAPYYIHALEKLEYFGPKILGALFIIIAGIFIAIIAYKFVMYLFKKFKIIELIDKLDFEIQEEKPKSKRKAIKEQREKSRLYITMQKKIQIDKVVAKAVAYYLFLVFFRISISVIGITDIEDFLKELLLYLPSLFIAFIIGFFGIRFANFIYDVVYHALDLTRQKTAKIIASGAKIIILFFTLMVVLDRVGIATEIINTILIGFISMLALAGGLAFGLGGKEIAKEILESLRK